MRSESSLTMLSAPVALPARLRCCWPESSIIPNSSQAKPIPVTNSQIAYGVTARLLNTRCGKTWAGLTM